LCRLNVEELVLLLSSCNVAGSPFLGKIDQWEESVDLCNLYVNKTRLYNGIMKKYPESSNVNDFIDELSTIAPKKTDIDTDFSKDRVKFTQDEEKIEFICTANNPEQSFTFMVMKQNGQD